MIFEKNIKGNEEVDINAKEGVNNPFTSMEPFCELSRRLKKEIAMTNNSTEML